MKSSSKYMITLVCGDILYEDDQSLAHLINVNDSRNRSKI